MVIKKDMSPQEVDRLFNNLPHAAPVEPRPSVAENVRAYDENRDSFFEDAPQVLIQIQHFNKEAEKAVEKTSNSACKSVVKNFIQQINDTFNRYYEAITGGNKGAKDELIQKFKADLNEDRKKGTANFEKELKKEMAVPGKDQQETFSTFGAAISIINKAFGGLMDGLFPANKKENNKATLAEATKGVGATVNSIPSADEDRFHF